LAVVAVVALFAAIYSSAACSLMEELELTVPGVTHLAVLSTLTGCALVAYAGCVLRDAGPVPPHWQPDTESPSQASPPHLRPQLGFRTRRRPLPSAGVRRRRAVLSGGSWVC
jgi:hypothetical protein